MSKAAHLTEADEPVSQSAMAPRIAGKPFAGLIDTVLVEAPVLYAFDGSILREDAQLAWTWAIRDVCPELIAPDAAEKGVIANDIEPMLPQMLTRMREALSKTEGDYEAHRRLVAQIGDEDKIDRLPVVINALRYRSLLVKAQALGKAANNFADEGALANTLQTMPLQDATLVAFLFHAMVGEVTNPSKLTVAALKLAGNAKEETIIRSGYGPLVDAMLAHAQNQLHLLQPMGAFADIDLTCRAIERFHRLMRALTGYIEFGRNSRWSLVLSAITKQVSERIEPRLSELVPDLNQGLRKAREGADRLDDDRLLSALNGMYLLTTVRDCRESLALNASFDLAWNHSGQALETHMARNLELLKQNPDDAVVGKRLDIGIKLAELRFNADYAETLRRARVAAEKRA